MWYHIIFDFDLLQLVRWSLGSSVLLQMVIFHSFLLISSILLHTHIIIIFIHSSANGCLGCFHDLTIVNSAAMNVLAMLSGKQNSLRRTMQIWGAVYYTGGPKAESPLSQGPWPAFVKIFYTPCPNPPAQISWGLQRKGKYNHNNPIIHVLCVQTVNNQ